MYAIAIEGERARNGQPFYLLSVNGKQHLQVFGPDKEKAIKFRTRKSAEDFLFYLPVTTGQKEVIEIEN